MARSGVSFTEYEMGIIESIQKQVPEYFNDGIYTWFRKYFDDERKVRLSDGNGLDKKIANGVYNCGGRINASEFRADISRIIYAQCKARIFKFLEARYPEGKQLEIAKEEIEEIISSVTANVDRYCEKSLIDGFTIYHTTMRI